MTEYEIVKEILFLDAEWALENNDMKAHEELAKVAFIAIDELKGL